MDGRVVLNNQPVGAFKTMTEVPILKSATAPSVIWMTPSVVKAGALPVTALLLQILVPPVAAVIDTVARAETAIRQRSNNTETSLLYISGSMNAMRAISGTLR